MAAGGHLRVDENEGLLDLRDSVHLSLGVPKNTLIAILLHYSLFHRTPPGTCIPYGLFTASCCTPLFKLDCLPTLFSASIVYLIIAIFFSDIVCTVLLL